MPTTFTADMFPVEIIEDGGGELVENTYYGDGSTTFVKGDLCRITTSGQIKDAKINEEKSSTHSYLKEIAKKSIYDASPFPNFPKDLDFSELSFNVIISFEVE